MLLLQHCIYWDILLKARFTPGFFVSVLGTMDCDGLRREQPAPGFFTLHYIV
jgi:hypothetical protein